MLMMICFRSRSSSHEREGAAGGQRELSRAARQRKMFQRNLTCSAPGSAEAEDNLSLEEIIR